MKIKRLLVSTNREKYPILIGSKLILNLKKIIANESINFMKCATSLAGQDFAHNSFRALSGSEEAFIRSITLTFKCIYLSLQDIFTSSTRIPLNDIVQHHISMSRHLQELFYVRKIMLCVRNLFIEVLGDIIPTFYEVTGDSVIFKDMFN